MRLYLNNIEGLKDFDIGAQWCRERTPGISAFMRVHNEEDWIEHSIRSIAFCDEIVVALQCCTDGTEKIVRRLAKELPLVVLEYPFESVANGPDHYRQKQGSVHERAYFYNWTLSHTSREKVLKWDGDMVALDGLGDDLRRARNGARFPGHEIVALNPPKVSKTHPLAAPETRMFRFDPERYYFTSSHCERLNAEAIVPHDLPARYLHFKWCKPEASITAAWPENWREIPHFQNIWKRSQAGDLYEGPCPIQITLSANESFTWGSAKRRTRRSKRRSSKAEKQTRTGPSEAVVPLKPSSSEDSDTGSLAS